jgi:hypothetical protein
VRRRQVDHSDSHCGRARLRRVRKRDLPTFPYIT